VSDEERRIEELRAALAARHEVLGVVAHDLRGPLNIITMGLEILRHGTPPGQESNIERMRRAIETMSDLVTTLVDVSHMRDVRTHLNTVTIYPEVLLRDVLIVQQPVVARYGLSLEHAACGRLPPLRADYERLLRVFANLVTHAARKARGGSTIRIEADCGEREGPADGIAAGVFFRVTYDGTPVRQDDLGLDVDAYFRLATAERKVSDLGLAFARSVIEAHGGRMVPPTDPAGEPVIRFWLPSPGAG
jgi:signal transduction histidine kinase